MLSQKITKIHSLLSIGFTAIALSFFVVFQLVSAADGSGTNSVTPTSAAAGSVGNTHTFTFTAAEAMSSGEVTITAPAGWTAPQGTNGVAGYTTATSSAGFIAKVEDTADSATGWAAGTACTSGIAADAGTKHEGAASIRCINGNEANNDRWYKNITSENWSTYTRIGFWIYSSAIIADGNLRFAYDNNTNIASPIEQITFGVAIPANTWTYVVVPFGATTRTAVLSYGFIIRSATALDNVTVRMDDLLLGPGVATFPSSGVVSARILQLAAGQTVQFTYGEGGGASGATAPSTPGVYTFTTSSRVSDSGALAEIASQPTITVTPGPLAKFTINDPGNITAGNRAAYTVTRQDQFNNDITSGSSTVYLYTDSSSPNAAFYDASTGGNLITSIVIPDGQSSASVWYYDELAGSHTVTFSDNATSPDGNTGVDDATDVIAVAAGAVAIFEMNDPGNMTAGDRVGYSVSRKDAYGNAVTTGTTTVYLSSDSASPNAVFYDAALGGNQISSTTIANASSSVNVWYYDELADTHIITASDNSTPDGSTGIDDATDEIVVAPAATSRFAINDVTSITAGSRAAYTVSRTDIFGNATSSGAQTAYLYNDASGNAAFYNSETNGSVITQVLIANGLSSASFWYYDDTERTVLITVSDNGTAPDGNTGIDDATDTLQVMAATTASYTLNSPANIEAGTRASYTVSRKDVFNNPTSSGAETVYLYSSSTSDAKAFYDAALGGAVITSIVIPNGSSSVNFWYYDELAGSYTITASDNSTAPDGLSGIDDATDAIDVTFATASKFVIDNPANAVVGENAEITIRTTDAFQNTVTTYQQDVTLLVSGSATGAGLVNITNGIGTKIITDTVVETVYLSLSDSEGTGLNVSATEDILFTAGPTRQLIINDVVDIVAGSRAQYTVIRQDQYGNLVTTGSETMYLYTNSSGGNAAFYDAASAGNEITSLTFGTGESEQQFWYYDEKSGSVTISVSDNATAADGNTGVDDAQDQLTVLAASTAEFTLNEPGNMVAGTRIGYVVTRKDQFGNEVTAGVTSVYFFTNSTGTNAAFYDAATVGNVVTQLEIPDASASVNVWYYDELAGTHSVTVSDNATAPDGGSGINDASDAVIVSPGSVGYFTLNNPGNMTAETRLGYTITRFDAYQNLVSTGSTTVYLYSDSSGNSVFYNDAVAGSPITSISISSGQTSADVWYYDDTAGTWTITASDNSSAPDGASGIDDATDAVEVTAIPITPTQFIILDPTDSTVGDNVEVTIRVVDNFGSIDTTYQNDITLLTTGSATGGGMVDIVNGVGTKVITDTVAETVTLSLQDTFGSGLATSSTQDVVFSAGPTHQFVLNDISTAEAGTRVEYTVLRRDSYGNQVTTGAELVYLYSSAGGVFYDAVSGGVTTTSAMILNGESSVKFWYENTQAESDTVTTSDNATAPDGNTGINDASDTLLVEPSVVAQLTLSDPGDISVGTRVGYVVYRKDQYGNEVSVGATQVFLYTNSSGVTAGFYGQANGGAEILSVTITNENSSAAFWYFDEEDGLWTITASDNGGAPDGTAGLDDATDTILVSDIPIVATKIVILDPDDVNVGETVVVTVQAVDNSGNIQTTFQDDVRLNASGSATGDGLVDIINGVGTLSISNTVAQTVTLSLTDTENTGLDVSSTQQVVFRAVGGGTSVGPDEVTPTPVVATPTMLQIRGVAYLGAQVTLQKKNSGGAVLQQQKVEAQDGKFVFEAEVENASAGYEVVITDVDGVSAPIISVVDNVSIGETTIVEVKAPPTLKMMRSAILRGNQFAVSGYAIPGNNLKLFIDNKEIAQIQQERDGRYNIEVATSELEYGQHQIVVKQVDEARNSIYESFTRTILISRVLNTRTDLNNDGRIDISDWSIFLTRWNSTDPDTRTQLDINNDGKVDLTDFSIFIRSIRK